MARVRLAEERVVRAGFRMVLEAQPDIEVIGEAGDGVAALELIRAYQPAYETGLVRSGHS